MFTIDIESVNGGIYRSREQATTLPAARKLVRDNLRGLGCYHLVFIADAETGRRIEYGKRGPRDGWTFWPMPAKTREDVWASLARMLGSEHAEGAMAVAAATGEHRFTRTDDYGVLHWRVRRYDNGTWALDKIPAPQPATT